MISAASFSEISGSFTVRCNGKPRYCTPHSTSMFASAISLIPAIWINLLKEMATISDKIILGDYLFPVKRGFWYVLNEVVEFAAGRNHYRNYKNFMANGGIHKLAIETGLKIITEIKNKPLTSHIIVLSK